MIIKDLGLAEYTAVWQQMRDFTDQRTDSTEDEIWLVQHPPVFTQGQAGKPEHVLRPGNIPVVQSDRGGQVTYHGPGQLVAYTLLDLRRAKLTSRQLVSILENAVIALLADYSITAKAKREAPGVYVDDAKICSIGLRIRRGCSYHGLALNVAMDLEPFGRINPCGYVNQKVTQLADLVDDVKLAKVKMQLIEKLEPLRTSEAL